MTDPLGPERMRAQDPLGMQALVRAWPDQIRSQRQSLAARPWPGALASPPPRLLAVGALGGSAAGAELVRGLYESSLPVPFLVVR